MKQIPLVLLLVLLSLSTEVLAQRGPTPAFPRTKVQVIAASVENSSSIMERVFDLDEETQSLLPGLTERQPRVPLMPSIVSRLSLSASSGALTVDEQAFLDILQWYMSTNWFPNNVRDSVIFEQLFTQLRAKVEQFILYYPYSDLRDDAFITLIAASERKGKNWFVHQIVQEYRSRFPNETTTYLRFTNTTAFGTWMGDDTYGANDRHSTFAPQDAYAQYVAAGLFRFGYDVIDPAIAIAESRRVIQDYPQSIWASTALVDIGTFYAGTNNDSARIAFETAIDSYQGRSRFAWERAFGHLGDLKFGDLAYMHSFSNAHPSFFSQNDYYEESRFLQSLNTRWDQYDTLFVVLTRTDSIPTALDTSITLQAFSQWQQVLENRIRFVLVPAATGSNFKITLYPQSFAGGAGVSTFMARERYNPLYSIGISLGIQRPDSARLKTAIHEIGHGLGLGHSWNNDDLMFYSTGSVSHTTFSKRDSVTISRLYPKGNVPPIIMNSMYAPSTKAGAKIYMNVNSEDMNGDPFTYSLSGNPAWMNIDPTTGVISGKPGNADTGNYAVTVGVNDGKGGSDSKSWNFSIVPNSNLSVVSMSFGSTVVQFGGVPITKTRDTILTINNTGTDTLRILAITSSSPLVTVRPSVAMIPPGGTLKDTVRFAPIVAGTVSSKIAIASNAPSSPDTIAVTGFGATYGLSVTSRSIALGSVKVGASKDTAIALTNTGNDTLRILSISSSRTAFVSKLTAATVVPGGLVKDTLRFSPTQAGADSTRIVIVSNAISSPDTIAVFGFGATYGIAFNSTKRISLGSVKVNTKRDSLVTISNTGNQPITISGITSSSSLFTVSPIQFTIALGASVKDTIRYIPTAVRADTARIIIASNASSSPDTIIVYANGALTGVFSELGVPTVFTLSQNYPNPFNPSTVIRYGLPMRSRVKLQIYDMLGRQVMTLVDEEQDAHYYEKSWHASVSSGLYFYRLEAVSSEDPSKSFVQVRKMLLLK